MEHRTGELWGREFTKQVAADRVAGSGPDLQERLSNERPEGDRGMRKRERGSLKDGVVDEKNV